MAADDMNGPDKIHRAPWLVFAALGTVGLALAYIIANQAYVSVESIDINTGHLRHEVSVMGLKYQDSVRPTDFSKAIAKVALVDSPNWKVYQSSTWWEPVSPHYRIHSLPFEIDELMAAVNQLDAENREKILQRGLELLRKEDITNLRALRKSLAVP